MASPAPRSLRDELYVIIFEHHTPAGRAFDVGLLWTVLLSVLVVVLESVASVRARYGTILRGAEWVFTGLFAVEYLARIYASPRRLRYVTSFFGIVDLVSIVPTIVGLFVPGAHQLLVIRVLRLLRVFRVLKIGNYGGEADVLLKAIRASLPKITVFIGTIVTVVVVVGAAMHLIEGPEHGFIDIPHSMYWAIVTLTTVGYGDIAPQTPLGRGLASLVMVLGYGIIAVPTGIVSAEIVRAAPPVARGRVCQGCGAGNHAVDAGFCRRCGAALAPLEAPPEPPPSS